MSRDPLRNLRALRHKVDAHSRRVESEHAPEFACRRGCDGCCQTERTVSDVEYAAVAQALAAVGADVHQRLAAQRQAEHCTLLLDGAFAIRNEYVLRTTILVRCHAEHRLCRAQEIKAGFP